MPRRSKKCYTGKGVEEETTTEKHWDFSTDKFPSYPRGILMKFSSTEMSYLKNVYVSTERVGKYEVILCQFYYPDNFAIGSIGKLGWKQFPRAKILGYHEHDVEWVALYYLDGKLNRVLMSAHQLKETNQYKVSEVEITPDGFLVVNVARNSHSNWAKPGLKKRIWGLANDIVGSDGEQKKFTWDQMEPARDINYPGCCHVSKGMRAQPPLRGGKTKGGQMPKKRATTTTNPWIAHVKEVARQKNIPYKDALKVASQSYKKKSLVAR